MQYYEDIKEYEETTIYDQKIFIRYILLLEENNVSFWEISKYHI